MKILELDNFVSIVLVKFLNNFLLHKKIENVDIFFEKSRAPATCLRLATYLQNKIK